MNIELIRRYISEYEREFDRIHNLEIYKWRAVKQFQDNWNSDANNFAEMLELSLSETRNLMAAAAYWPARMIIAYAEKNPELVRNLFDNLFNEENDVLERISSFQQGIKEFNAFAFPGKSDYQDHRAVLVYLNLRYPDNYFLYKYGMLKIFCEKVEHDYKPKLGATSNIVQYFGLCEIVREEIELNNNLLKLHKNRIGENEYFDKSSHMLTQDFIYAVAQHLNLSEEILPKNSSKLTLKQIDLHVSQKEYKFTGKYTDHISRQKHNKYIGDLGEQIVLQYESSKCPSQFVDKIIHSAKSEGDGLGFDILSYDDTGCQKYIEVKATKGPATKPFYISGTELERSRIEGEKYFLYRLFNLDEQSMTADCFILQGDLGKYCINPTEYEVILKV